MDKAREAAARILYAVHEQGAYANIALAKELRRHKFTELDRRFVTELAYGAIKAGDTLDWIIGHYVKRPLADTPPMVRELLRLGVYQLFYLDKVPASAVCNEMTECAKKYGRGGTVKFVNAVLREAARSPEKAAFPAADSRTAEALALNLQHPLWLTERWLAEFGYEETKQLLAFNNTSPPLSLRANSLKLGRHELRQILGAEGVAAELSAWSPEGLLVTAHRSLDSLPSLKDGLWLAQDESSLQVAPVVDPKPGELIIDACSAPGGKATHLAALMGNKGRVVALDVHGHKLKLLAENATRLGISIIEPHELDARRIGSHYAGQADRVLVDAPCSGLGVLRRRPDARWRKTAADIGKLERLQREILVGAAKAVKPGGVLVYSTCTMTAEENTAVVTSFLAANDDFSLENTGAFLPLKKRTGSMVQLYPQRDGTDGFFLARMRRKG